MSDLDDFFAKKSRKKKTKNSSAVLAGDLLNQKKEQEVRKQKKLKDKDDKSSEPLSAFLKKTMEEDDEWNDMETEKEPTAADLSRIQNLTISRETEQTREGEDRSNAGAEHEDHTREEGEKGGAAWGASGQEQPNGTGSDDESDSGCGDHDEPSKEAPAPTPAVKESRTAAEEPAEAEGAKSGGSAPKAYIAPHLRNRAAAGSEFSLGGTSDYSRSKFQKKVKAPDIGNVEEFPTLGGNPRNEGGAWGSEATGGRGFTKVQHGGTSGGNTRSGHTRHGGTRADGGKRTGESLTLENRYATLSDDC